MMKDTSPHCPRRSILCSGLAMGGSMLLTHRGLAASPAERPPALRFGLIADVQYADAPPKNTRHYRLSLAKLRDCIDAMNRQDLPFVVQVGDLIDRDFRSFEPVMTELARLRVPLYHTLGNHDFEVSPERRGDIARRLGLECTYFDFVPRASWRFVILDGNTVSTFAAPAGSPQHAEAQAMIERLKAEGAAHGRSFNGGIDRVQVDWLEATLNKADRAGERVIIFCHYPLAPADHHNLLNDAVVRQMVLDHRCVQAWINGHNHHGAYAQQSGVHFVTLHGMVETADTTAWAIATLDDKHLRIDGRGREPVRILPLRGTQ